MNRYPTLHNWQGDKTRSRFYTIQGQPNNRARSLVTGLLGLLLVTLSGCGKIDNPELTEGSAERQPLERSASHTAANSEANANRNLYWGDLHIHTSLSYDAYVMGARILPDDAYRFSKGEPIEHAIGYQVQIDRPLDFAAVTDHGEYLGVARALGLNGEVDELVLKDLHENRGALAYTLHYLRTLRNFMADREKKERDYGKVEYEGYSNDAWQTIKETADQHNQPGEFTAFVGYEWSSIPNGENLHRNVIYKDSAIDELPFSARDSNNPEDLWDALDAQRQRGIDVIAISHNGNSSNGRMYALKTYNGDALSADYAEQRMRNEPIAEIFQVKGSSETHPLISPDDDFAGFEIYDSQLNAEAGMSNPEGSYARNGLKRGLNLQSKEGFNPYQFGVIGSSDSHNGTSSVEEDAYHGKMPMLDGSATVRLRERLIVPDKLARGSPWSAQGLAAVWAIENTREAIFAALRRKETYATSGPRIGLRFFATANFEAAQLEQPGWEAEAYANGVAMGGTLTASADSPSFVVSAAKDPIGANLDRLQIVKAWVEDGETYEKVFDIALANAAERRQADGSIKAVGNTVDVDTASYSNSIGTEQLAAVWRDPDFDSDQEAFYYARAIEIPTPRWSTHDAKALDIEPWQPTSLQERAVSSAIWVQPATP